MANVWNEAKLQLFLSTLDMENDAMRLMLFTTSPAVMTDAQKDLTTVADVLSDSAFTEATDASYTGQGANGRITLTGVNAQRDDVQNQAEFFADDPTWTALDNDLLRSAMILKFSVNDAGSTPVCLYPFVGAQQTNGGDVTLLFPITIGFLTLL